MFFNPLPTGKISDTVYAVKVGMVNFYIYQRDDHMICIDAGFRKRVIVKALKELDIDPEGVSHLLLTHSDFDHAAGLPIFPKADVFLSADEEKMVTRKKSRRGGVIFNAPIRRAYHLLSDNDAVSAGSITVRAIATPGHTPGSMSYLVDDAILFTGDTLLLKNGEILPFKRYFNMDTKLQKESIRKLANLENVQMIFTAHTGFTKEVQAAFNRWDSTRNH